MSQSSKVALKLQIVAILYIQLDTREFVVAVMRLLNYGFILEKTLNSAKLFKFVMDKNIVNLDSIKVPKLLIQLKTN